MQMNRTLTDSGEATLTVDEFAEAVGVHPVTVRRWISAGLVTVERTPTRRIRIPASEVRDSITVHTATREATTAIPQPAAA